MTATTLRAFFDVVYLLALTAWVGSVLFFSFGVAPVIFRVLGAEAGGRFVRALFPRYYTWGATCGAVALPAIVCAPMAYPELRGPLVGIQALLVLIATLVMLYCGNALTPAINAARDSGEAGRQRFDRLHRRSVQLNGLVLVIGLGLLILFALRPEPKSAGIVEPKPGELTEGQAKVLRDDAEISRRTKAILEGKEPPPKGFDPSLLKKPR